jgi:hypothetical protein
MEEQFKALLEIVIVYVLKDTQDLIVNLLLQSIVIMVQMAKYAKMEVFQQESMVTVIVHVHMDSVEVSVKRQLFV